MSEQNIEKEQLYKGVFRAGKKDGTVYYRASLTKNGKHISLGSFSDALQAHRAYEQGLLLLSDPSLTLQSYEKVSPLSFEKWVSLINLRDNGLYIGNPIYLGQQLFYYYLSPHHVLKFDMEDLFYYSSHKIMWCRSRASAPRRRCRSGRRNVSRRGGHAPRAAPRIRPCARARR